MIDSHYLPGADWGVRPILFNFYGQPIESYPVIIFLALIVGLGLFFYNARKQKSLNENTLYIILTALIGGILGSKIPVWIVNYKLIIASFPNIAPLLSGRTIVGGLIGGTLAVMLLKYKLGIKSKKGNIFAGPVALGITIGRIGCFLRGCCYGTETSLPWGVDFGDGILRHPTQIYEAVFLFGLFIYLQSRVQSEKVAGRLFKILMVSYFTFRFFIEFIRVEEVIFSGLTGFQIASLLVIGYYLLPDLIKKIYKREAR